MNKKILLLAFLMISPALAQEPDVPLELYCFDFEIGKKTYNKQQDMHILQYKDWTISLDGPPYGCGHYGCVGSIDNKQTGESFSTYFDCLSQSNGAVICSLNKFYWNFVRTEDKNIYRSAQCRGEDIRIDKRQCKGCECFFITEEGQDTFSRKCKEFDENNITCFTHTGYEDRYIGRYDDVNERYMNCKTLHDL